MINHGFSRSTVGSKGVGHNAITATMGFGFDDPEADPFFDEPPDEEMPMGPDEDPEWEDVLPNDESNAAHARLFLEEEQPPLEMQESPPEDQIPSVQNGGTTTPTGPLSAVDVEDGDGYGTAVTDPYMEVLSLSPLLPTLPEGGLNTFD